jgi:hypothetical protein
MADYAGAVAAIKQRMIDNWTTTRILFQNTAPDDPWPPIDVTSTSDPKPLAPYVYFEVIGNGSRLRGAGTPGDHIWIYSGLIAAHVFVPINTGTDLAQQYAVSIGEIFRAQGFYNDGQGRIVRTWSPRTDGGGSDADNGNWFVVTCRIPFEYWHRG